MEINPNVIVLNHVNSIVTLTIENLYCFNIEFLDNGCMVSHSVTGKVTGVENGRICVDTSTQYIRPQDIKSFYEVNSIKTERLSSSKKVHPDLDVELSDNYSINIRDDEDGCEIFRVCMGGSFLKAYTKKGLLALLRSDCGTYDSGSFNE